MSKMIQIRNVPDDVHRELEVRSARTRMSLSEYLVAELGNEPSLRSGEAAAAVRSGRSK